MFKFIMKFIGAKDVCFPTWLKHKYQSREMSTCWTDGCMNSGIMWYSTITKRGHSSVFSPLKKSYTVEAHWLLNVWLHYWILQYPVEQWQSKTRLTQKCAWQFTTMVLSISSSGHSSRWWPDTTPALLINKSTSPTSLRTFSAMEYTLSLLPTSTTYVYTCGWNGGTSSTPSTAP